MIKHIESVLAKFEYDTRKANPEVFHITYYKAKYIEQSVLDTAEQIQEAYGCRFYITKTMESYMVIYYQDITDKAPNTREEAEANLETDTYLDSLTNLDNELDAVLVKAATIIQDMEQQSGYDEYIDKLNSVIASLDKAGYLTTGLVRKMEKEIQ